MKRIPAMILTAALLLALCACSVTNTVTEAENHLNATGINEADVEHAGELLMRAAEAGDADAMYYLGLMYQLGSGGERNYQTAAEWYEKAAEAGNSKGSYALGELYEYGYGVEQDLGKALEWFEKAAEADDAGGMLKIGYYYYNSITPGGESIEDFSDWVGSNAEKAIDWYQKACDAGFPEERKQRK